jgi:hypothetical protein
LIECDAILRILDHPLTCVHQRIGIGVAVALVVDLSKDTNPDFDEGLARLGFVVN